MNDDREKARLIADDLGSQFLFGSVYLLDLISNFKKHLVFYRRFYDPSEAEEIHSDFLEGFKFAVIALLHQIIIQVIQSPELIGVRTSKAIDWAFAFGQRGRGKIHNLPNKTAHGILISNLLAFRKQILKAENFRALKHELSHLLDYTSWFKAIFSSCYSGFRTKEGKSIGPEEVLEMKIPGVMLIFLNDGRKLSKAFADMYRMHKGKFRLKHLKRPFEQFPDVREIPLEEAMKDKSFFKGFIFANISLWNSILGDSALSRRIKIFNDLKKTETWGDFDRFFGIINDRVVRPIENKTRSNSVQIRRTDRIPKTLNRRLIVPIKEPRVRSIRLADALNHRPARVVSCGGANGALDFSTVLLGLQYQRMIGQMKEKIQVIEFVHKRNRDKIYSYGIFMPCSSWISDCSHWWIFYACAADRSFDREYIKMFLEKNKRSIHKRRFTITEKRFFDYLKSDYVKFIENESQKAVNINAHMRGAILELLVAFHFTKLGFEVMLRHKSQVLGKELDVVAVKKDKHKIEVYVVECKERSVTVDSEEFDRYAKIILDELTKKVKCPIGVSPYDVVTKMLEEFAEEINLLTLRLADFLKEIGIRDEKDTKLVGVFATTEVYEAPVRYSPKIEFWTWWTLKKKLTHTKIDKSLIRIIEKHLEGSAGRPIADLHFFRDYFD